MESGSLETEGETGEQVTGRPVWGQEAEPHPAQSVRRLGPGLWKPLLLAARPHVWANGQTLAVRPHHQTPLRSHEVHTRWVGLNS